MEDKDTEAAVDKGIRPEFATEADPMLTPPSTAGSQVTPEEIATSLELAISQGRICAGQSLAGEHELAQQLGVSRSTIRRALEDLEQRGLTEPRAGLGSFIIGNSVPLDQGGSWSKALSDSQISSRVEVLRSATVNDPDLALSTGSSVTHFLAIDRLRYLEDGTPFSLECSRIPLVKCLEPYAEEGLVEDSISATLAACGIEMSQGKQWIHATPLSEGCAKLLQRPTGTIFFHTVRQTYTADGDLIEKVTSFLDPSVFHYYLEF